MEDSVTVLEPGRAERNYWSGLWRYRELFLILAWRDVAVRYKQTVIGLLWVILRPFITMVIFSVVFGRLAGLQSEDGAPYPLLVFSAMLPWSLFSTALVEASGSLIGNERLISKVYFPRLIIPAATIVSAFVDFLVSLVILLGLMLYYRFVPGWSLLLLPVFVLLAILTSMGPGILLTALNLKYRDFRYLVPFIAQVGLYISPVGFSSRIVPASWRFLYSLNPMVGVIDGFRWSILGGSSPIYLPGFALSIVISLGFLYVGISRFRKMEKSFADFI